MERTVPEEVQNLEGSTPYSSGSSKAGSGSGTFESASSEEPDIEYNLPDYTAAHLFEVGDAADATGLVVGGAGMLATLVSPAAAPSGPFTVARDIRSQSVRARPHIR